MKIKMVVDMRLSSNRKIDVNSVFEARKTPGSLLPMIAPYQIIEGPFSGIQIPVTHCVELQEEPTYSLAEYTEVHQELLKRREEVKELTKQLEEDREAKKVVLPREVAEAIEGFRGDSWENITILRNAINPSDDTTPRSLALREYARKYIFDICRALEFGYTVEETPKQKAIQYCIKHGLVARGHSEHDVVSAIMSILGTEQSG